MRVFRLGLMYFWGGFHDLMGRRREALAQYEAALVTAGAYPLALQAAQQGLKKPFGTLLSGFPLGR